MAPFAELGDSISHVALSAEGNTQLPVVDVFPELGASDLAKIDIEGSEWAILEDARLMGDGPRVIVLEYHAAHRDDDARFARSRAVTLLGRARYVVADVAPTSEIAGMLWAWRA